MPDEIVLTFKKLELVVPEVVMPDEIVLTFKVSVIVEYVILVDPDTSS